MNAVIHTEGMSLNQKAILSGVIKGEREDIDEKARSSRHDRVGEKLRGNQRKGRPYIRRSSTELKKEAKA